MGGRKETRIYSRKPVWRQCPTNLAMSASSTSGVEASDGEAATVWLVWRGNRFETSSDGVEGVYLSAGEGGSENQLSELCGREGGKARTDPQRT
jgi:hypothetical protein